MRLKLQELYGFKAFNSYGLSEMNGPGVAFDAPCQNGMHIWEDATWSRSSTPRPCSPSTDGEVGELVLTTLRRIAMPIIRYRTRDLDLVMLAASARAAGSTRGWRGWWAGPTICSSCAA